MRKGNKGGRPTVMTSEVVSKLEYGFIKGMNDAECCYYAGISRQALYDYCNKYPEFADRKEALKKSTAIQAKLNITEEIENGNVDLSKWYLERRNKEEFSARQEVSAEVSSEVTISIDLVDEE